MHANSPGENAFADKQKSTKRRESFLLVIYHFHTAILLNPKLTDNDVMDTAGGVCPGVAFIISAKKVKMKLIQKGVRADL